jgi:hypothetical protein
MYLETRKQRRTATVEKAMDERDREQQRTGYSWPSPEDRFMARRETGLEAEEEFDLSEPLLGFEDWLDAGGPQIYRAEDPISRAKGLLARMEKL